MILPNEVRYRHAWLHILRSIVLYQPYNLIHHFGLKHIFPSIPVDLIQAPPGRMTLRQLRMQPHLNPAILIHTHQILRDLEIPHTLIQLLKPLQRAEQNIQILRIRYILYITQPHGYVLNIHLSCVIGIAKFFTEFVIEVFCVDDVVLALTPLEELQVLLELC